MGRIKQLEGGQERLLAPCTVIGRARGCDLQLPSPEVSTEHAAIRWLHGRWRVFDLGSRNGTWVAGERLTSGVSVELPLRATLCFGSPRDTWVCVSDEPPVVFVHAFSTREDRALEDDLLALPSDEDPQILVLRQLDGRCFVEDSSGRREAEDRELLHGSGERWRLHLAPQVQQTQTAGDFAPPLSQARLTLRHDQTEEHVTAELHPPGRAGVNLGARAHHSVVLELARARLEDRARGIAPSEEGWIHRDELSQRLGLEVNHINIQIHRLRQQLDKAGVIDGHRVVERRDRSGLLRLGPRTVEIDRL